MSEETGDSTKSGQSKLDLAPFIDILKAVGFIGGGVGSIALLFFYIGNAVIIARLRVYNLYGSVHYTDEYVREAGYQFLQDLFTFFARWEFGMLFILSILLLFILIPLGPAKTKAQRMESSSKKSVLESFLMHLKYGHINENIRYLLFAGIAVTAVVMLTSGVIVQNLIGNIMEQELLLEALDAKIEQNVLTFIPRDDLNPKAKKKYFHKNLYRSINQDSTWIPDVLVSLFEAEKKLTQDLDENIKIFQDAFQIDEENISTADWEKFLQSETFDKLSIVKLNRDIQEKLALLVKNALHSIRIYLSGHLEESPEHMVISPGVYDIINADILKLQRYVNNLEYFFQAHALETKLVMKNLNDIKPIRFAGATLSFSFWILIGLLIYLLLNSVQILKFNRWEQVYYLFMILMFLIIAVALPTIYGRYKFEFRVQALNGFELKKAEDSVSAGSIERLIKRENLNMYILGPTKGKEIIIASIPSKISQAIDSDKERGSEETQIMIFDKNDFKSMVLQQIPPKEIPMIIQSLKHRFTSQ